MQKTSRVEFKSILTYLSLALNILFISAFLFNNSPISAEATVGEVNMSYNSIKPEILAVHYVKEIALPKEDPITEIDLINIYILEVSRLYDVDASLIHSIVWHESRYTPTAKNGNCLGLMQVCTKWHIGRAEKLGVSDFYDIRGNILLGVDYISELLEQTGNDIGLTLMLYNMNHKLAYEYKARGELSWYAESVIKRMEDLKLRG